MPVIVHPSKSEETRGNAITQPRSHPKGRDGMGPRMGIGDELFRAHEMHSQLECKVNCVAPSFQRNCLLHVVCGLESIK